MKDIFLDNNLLEGHITKELIRQFLPDYPVIVEAGAHIGRDTAKMARLWPDATIYAFEPVPALYEQLKESVKEFRNVHCFPLALSTKKGTATFYVSSGASTAASSLLEPYEYSKARPDVHFQPITVETMTLDQWAKQEGIKKVDFLWLDMQGHELAVLKAAPKMLSTAKALLVEASLIERFKSSPLVNEVKSWIESQGFKALLHDSPKHDKINIFFARAIP